jgi:hypothetical protein
MSRAIITHDSGLTLSIFLAYAVDFSGENDALRPGNAVSWAKNSKSTSQIAWSDLCVVAGYSKLDRGQQATLSRRILLSVNSAVSNVQHLKNSQESAFYRPLRYNCGRLRMRQIIP